MLAAGTGLNGLGPAQGADLGRGSEKASPSSLAPRRRVPVAFETNGKGWHGFLVLPPGAFVRGPTLRAALSKTDREVRTFLRWAGVRAQAGRYQGYAAEERRSALRVEDADSEILLAADVGELAEPELAAHSALARRSADSFQKLWDGAALPDWVDARRVGRTFWGESPTTIREVYAHVLRTQSYYLTRLGLGALKDATDLAASRGVCLEALAEGWKKGIGSGVREADGELWTLRKVLRRLLWHDRIHAKAVVRILEEQRREGLIERYEDPFGFLARPD